MTIVDQASYERTELRIPGSWAWAGWALLCVFVNFELADGLHFSQLLLLVAVGLWFTRDLRGVGRNVAVAATLGMLVVSLSAGGLIWRSGSNARLAQELGKIILLVAGTMALKDLDEEVFEAWTFWLPVSVAGLAVIVYVADAWRSYDPYRFSIPTMGSSNSLGYVIAVCLIMAHYSWGVSGAPVRRLMLALTTTILGVVLLATQSRGGILQYAVGLALFTRHRLALMATVGALAIALLLAVPDIGTLLARYNLLLDLQETGGSGRLFVWRQLVASSLSNPWHALVGFGPGSVALERTGREVVSAHSLLVETLYYFGLVGTSAGLYGLARMGVRLYRASTEGRRRRMNVALYGTFLTGALVDSYALNAQLLWFTAVLLAFLVVAGRERGGSQTTPESA